MLPKVLLAALFIQRIVTAGVLVPKPPHRPGSQHRRIVSAGANTTARATATFAMGCYYHGEERLGSLDGVLSTRAGIRDGEEVVEVTYDPNVLVVVDWF